MLFIHIRVYWENPSREISKKLNEFVRDVEGEEGDIYGIGTYGSVLEGGVTHNEI